MADTVLDFLWFLYFTDEDVLEFDYAAGQTEQLIDTIENQFTAEEKQALQDAATRRLNNPKITLTPDQQGFLKHTAAGHFSITGFDEDDYDE